MLRRSLTEGERSRATRPTRGRDVNCDSSCKSRLQPRSPKGEPFRPVFWVGQPHTSPMWLAGLIALAGDVELNPGPYHNCPFYLPLPYQNQMYRPYNNCPFYLPLPDQNQRSRLQTKCNGILEKPSGRIHICNNPIHFTEYCPKKLTTLQSSTLHNNTNRFFPQNSTRRNKPSYITYQRIKIPSTTHKTKQNNPPILTQHKTSKQKTHQTQSHTVPHKITTHLFSLQIELLNSINLHITSRNKTIQSNSTYHPDKHIKTLQTLCITPPHPTHLN